MCQIDDEEDDEDLPDDRSDLITLSEIHNQRTELFSSVIMKNYSLLLIIIIKSGFIFKKHKLVIFIN